MQVQVQGPVFSVQGSKFRIQGAGFKIQGSGFIVEDIGVRGRTSRPPDRLRKMRTTRRTVKGTPTCAKVNNHQLS